jgi:hypothetical protein
MSRLKSTLNRVWSIIIIRSCFFFLTFFFFLWRAADTIKNVDWSREMRLVAKMLIICFVTFYFEMWNVIEKCDFRFSFTKIFLWIRFRDHAWSFHRLCFDCLTRVFFEMTNVLRKRSSNSTKATHQTCYERYFIRFDESHVIKLDEWYFIKFNEWYLIKLDEWYFIKFNKRYFIKTRRRFCLLS